jgi:hypothetical protein
VIGKKLDGVVPVMDDRGRLVAQRMTKHGRFRFVLPAGRYRLGPRRLGGCRRPVVTIRAGRTTRSDLGVGCSYR